MTNKPRPSKNTTQTSAPESKPTQPPALRLTNWNSPDLSLASGQTVAAPMFPREMLREQWAGWCEATADSANAPYDYVATSLLTTAAALIGNARIAAFGDWTEPSVIWSVLIGPPSAKKSPAMAPLVAHVSALEAELVAAHDPEDGPAPQLRLGDVTYVAAAEVAADNAKGVLLQKDEVSGWWSLINRTGGEHFWLEATGGRPYPFKRANKKTINIPHLAVSVLGTAQPDPIRDLLEAKTDRGFSSRFLYVYPEIRSGFRPPQRVDQTLARAALRRLRDLPLHDGHPVSCPLTPEAEELTQSWVTEHERRLRRADGLWAEWLGKQNGMLLRYALVLQHLWWAAEERGNEEGPQVIGVDAIKAAATFIDAYAKPMAARSFSMAARPVGDRHASFLARVLQRQEAVSFNAREVRRNAFGPVGVLAQPEAMQEACEILVKACLIRKIGERAGGTKGRSPETYEVNPALLEA